MHLNKVIAKTGVNKTKATRYFNINIMTAGVIKLRSTLTISKDKEYLLIGEEDATSTEGAWKISKITDIYTMKHDVWGEITHIVIEP